MNSRLPRRAFNVATAASLLSAASWPTTATAGDERQKTLDLHVHLFGVEESGSGCQMAELIKHAEDPGR